MKKIAALLPIGILMAAMASADTLNLSLANPIETGIPGSTVSFTATVSAPITNAADIYLNSDSNNIDYPLTLDDSGFFFGFPASLAPGGSFTGTLFTVTIPNFANPQAYQGYFEIDGGGASNASNFLASVNFQLVVTPEPQSFVLLLIGFSMLLMPLLWKRCIS